MSSNTTYVTSLEEIGPYEAVFRWVQMAYGVPLLIAMIVLLFRMKQKKKYASNFYRLVQLDLVVNILCYINTWFAVRMAKFKWTLYILKLIERRFPGFLTYSRLFMNFFMHMQVDTAVLLTAHRISTFTGKFVWIWEWWFVLTIILAVFNLCVVYFPVVVWKQNAAETILVNDRLMSRVGPEDMGNLMVFNGVCLLLYFFLMTSLLLLGGCLAKRDARISRNTSRRMEKNFNKLASTYAVMDCGNLLWCIIRSVDVFRKFLPDYIRDNPFALMFVSDMMTLFLPAILGCIDFNVRQDINKFFKKLVPRCFQRSRVIPRQPTLFVVHNLRSRAI